MSYTLYANLNKNYKPLKFRMGGKDHFQIYLGIQSSSDPDLNQVEQVTYTLHSTFKDRVRESRNRKRQFEIEIYAWGTFVVKFEIKLVNGTTLVKETNMADVLTYVSL